MSFRRRLSLFFVFIVVIPMVSVGIALIGLINDNVRGKVDGRIVGRQEVVIGIAAAARQRAAITAQRIGRDTQVAAALRAGDQDALRTRATTLLRTLRARRIVLTGPGGNVLVDVGGRTAVFPASIALQDTDRSILGRLQVSVQGPRDYVREAAAAANFDVVVATGARVVAASSPALQRARLPRPTKAQDFTFGDEGFRLTSRTLQGSFLGGEDVVWLLQPSKTIEQDVTSSRWVAASTLVGFMILALLFAFIIIRSLQRQIAGFLDAARRIGAGDFAAQAPIEGRDEFAALGREFNAMAVQLRERLDELRSERSRLQGAMRRIGETFAANLDRDALLEIVIETAVDGTGAAAGRAVVRPRPGAPLQEVASTGVDDAALGEVIRAAEARVLETGVSADVAVEGVRAVAHPLRPQDGGDALTGVVSVARLGREFSEPERELFAYLAAQAAVSVENVGLHETVERQAVTDELTGLCNRRRFDEALAAEAERARRLGGPVGLLMLDIDNFKKVNDTYGHQQGDLVLQEVSRVLRESCREIDEPARYGGEELAAVLPGTDLDGAFNLAERVRTGLEALEIPLLGGTGTMAVTASFGVATMPSTADDEGGLVAAADEALYRAKRSGKNRVERAPAAVQ